MQRRLAAVAALRASKPMLEEPVQVCMSAGDVVFAMHKVAHLGGPNYSPELRRMVYFRVSHQHLAQVKRRAMEDLWVEYEGMQEVLDMMK
ncbi:hypothetical protein B484DRAFT_401208 [Ochromonadaceae sp. CCMP2298]|nr:hypothetical protein B484DRAFT_401208 [Ochromonadaceae sp. CCMP2298]